MADLTLVRVGFPRTATLGVLKTTHDDLPFVLTLEREYDGGSNRKSAGDTPGACIPAGTYVCKRVISPKFGDTFEVTGVPGRSHILFHAGNLADDSRGCILIGSEFDPVKGHAEAVTASKKSFDEFMRLQGGVMSFNLYIVNVLTKGAAL